ncbi:MAG: hypothetical protein WCF65_09155, partial [Parachlamydiaceae bacterium]
KPVAFFSLVVLPSFEPCRFPELEGYQGNHYPNNSYVKFKIRAPMPVESKEDIKQKAGVEFNSWIDQNLKVAELLDPSGIRIVKVFENWSPCGGTHVESLKDTGKLSKKMNVGRLVRKTLFQEESFRECIRSVALLLNIWFVLTKSLYGCQNRML